MFPYQDKNRSTGERVHDLLSRMTIEEKIGEMIQLDGRGQPLENYRKYKPGSFLQILDHDTVEVQKLALSSRLGIPLLFGIDAIHGHSFYPGATMFPTQLTLSCSWDPSFAREMGTITAREMNGTGVHWTFSPVLCMARDLRWGRVNETFGEDQLLIGDMACATIEGYQGSSLADPHSVLACAKHFAGYSETQGGRDSTEADMSQRKLQSFFLPAFRRAARGGCATFMSGYHAIDGVPCTANHWLLTDVLKRQWGFRGFVVTDWKNIGHMINEQKVCATFEDAAALAINAGNDMMMAQPEFFDGALAAFRKGRVRSARIDDACGRILAVKFSMGLFEDQRWPVPAHQRVHIGCTEHRNSSLQAARESIVVLKNTGALPIDISKCKTIAVCGPNADDPLAQMGDWTLGTGQANKKAGEHPRQTITTVLDGIRQIAGSAGACVLYTKGCELPGPGGTDIAAAVDQAAQSDICIAVVGDNRASFGEWDKSTARLELPGDQERLVRALKGTGKPLVVVLINSKPMCIPWIADNADAVVEAFNPGMLGGQAVAEIVFGIVNPCGKLSISFPKHVGQQPVWYNQHPGQHGNTYCDLDQEPQYCFGHGLSYARFSYRNLRVHKEKLSGGEPLRVSVDIANGSGRDGYEIAQLYVCDKVTSRTWPQKMLKAYKKVLIEAHASVTVDFSVSHEDLAIFTLHDTWEVEPGEFEVMVGPSSSDADLLRAGFAVVAL